MISFRYELQGAGWADAFLSDGTVAAHIPASYICDALGDLVDAVRSLFTTDKAECVWLEEPGEARWHFYRSGETLQISIEWFNEIRVDVQRGEFRITEDRLVLDRIMFSGRTDFIDFANQVDQELQALLKKWNVEGYLKEWDHPFPQEAHRRLREAIAIGLA